MYRQRHWCPIFCAVLLDVRFHQLRTERLISATHHHNVTLPRDLDLALAEVHERCHARDARAVQQVAVVGEKMQSKADLPYLECVDVEAEVRCSERQQGRAQRGGRAWNQGCIA